MHYLFVMLGAPGAGKSYVSAWLSPLVGAVHLRSDDLRLAMYGQDRLELHRNNAYRQPLFGAMDYAARQTLAAGHSVIYDTNTNRRSTRGSLAQAAREHGARAIVVYIDIPLATAKQRVLARAEQGGHQIFDGVEFVERLARNIEQPTADELVIRLDGQQSAARQQASFESQLAAIARNPVQ